MKWLIACCLDSCFHRLLKRCSPPSPRRDLLCISHECERVKIDHKASEYVCRRLLHTFEQRKALQKNKCVWARCHPDSWRWTEQLHILSQLKPGGRFFLSVSSACICSSLQETSCGHWVVIRLLKCNAAAGRRCLWGLLLLQLVCCVSHWGVKVTSVRCTVKLMTAALSKMLSVVQRLLCVFVSSFFSKLCVYILKSYQMTCVSLLLLSIFRANRLSYFCYLGLF